MFMQSLKQQPITFSSPPLTCFLEQIDDLFVLIVYSRWPLGDTVDALAPNTRFHGIC